MAKRFDDAENFEKFYSWDIYHGYYWHLTNNPDFTLSDNIGSRDMSSMGSGSSLDLHTAVLWLHLI